MNTPPADLEYPKLRFLEVFPVETNNGPVYGLRDPNGIATETLLLSQDIFYLLQFFDGSHSLVELRSKYYQASGHFLKEDQLADILTNLDSHLFLQNRNFESKFKAIEDAFRSLQIRPAVYAGKSYEADPDKLRKEINGFFENPGGAGRPDLRKKKTSIKGLVAPHIDVCAGGACYSHAYRALAESSGADCFVILGTGHSGLTNLYSTVAKDFDTPFGPAKCDTAFIDLLKSNYDGDIEADILAHKSEHVIEFQLAFLKHVYEKKQDFTFVPLLCSFSYHMLNDAQFPRESAIIDSFAAALKTTISEFDKKVCLIASVDLSHVGPRFGDDESPDSSFLSDVRQSDLKILQNVEKLDSEGFYESVMQHEDRYRVCGFSSIYTLLKAIDARDCTLLDYSKTEVDDSRSTVTFASLVLQ